MGSIDGSVQQDDPSVGSENDGGLTVRNNFFDTTKLNSDSNAQMNTAYSTSKPKIAILD
jgi:hypothetical protein